MRNQKHFSRDTNHYIDQQYIDQFIIYINLILQLSILVFVEEQYQYCNIRAIYSSNMKRPYLPLTILDFFGNILLNLTILFCFNTDCFVARFENQTVKMPQMRFECFL